MLLSYLHTGQENSNAKVFVAKLSVNYHRLTWFCIWVKNTTTNLHDTRQVKKVQHKDPFWSIIKSKNQNTGCRMEATVTVRKKSNDPTPTVQVLCSLWTQMANSKAYIYHLYPVNPIPVSDHWGWQNCPRISVSLQTTSTEQHPKQNA